MSFHDTENPKGGVNMEHVIEKPAPNVNLLERILSQENMRQSWKRVKANKGVAGVDGMSIEEFPEYAQKHWRGTRQTVLDGTYKPKPVLACGNTEGNGRKPTAWYSYGNGQGDSAGHGSGTDTDI